MRHPWSRAVWRKAGRNGRLFVSGRVYALPVRDAQSLAAATAIDGARYGALSQAGRDAVIDLVAAGHYQLLADEEE
jgi:50S ribosomal protein L16 3-hydroxylase